MLNGRTIPMSYRSSQDELAIPNKLLRGLEFITNGPDYGGAEEVHVGCWHFSSRVMGVAKLNIWSCNYEMGSINKQKLRHFNLIYLLLHSDNLQCCKEMRFYCSGVTYYALYFLNK